MDELTFHNLVNLKADQWNRLVADVYDVPVEELKELVLMKDLKSLDSQLRYDISKDNIEALANYQASIDHENALKYRDGDDSVLYEPSIIDKFRVKVTDTKDIVDSIALTGKIVIGADFTKSNLSDSYFCGCTFYNCKFNEVNFGNSIFVSCDFITTSLKHTDFNGSTMSRCHFYECNLTSSVFDYVALSDCMVVNSVMDEMSAVQSRILFSGFSDCVMDDAKWKDTDIVVSTFTNVSMKNIDFKRSVISDSIFIRTDLTGCDLSSLSVTCITITDCKYDDRYKHFFDMEQLLYSPSVFEWESHDTPDSPDSESDINNKSW